ncbi:ABC transporter ATP-binding protein [Celerinatantimonas yamalensis]|uniref:Sn-glycerol-3-phosphate ABC transporter ATP-binding protein UgpC n=1 Tax=Celerinatantimonas yamalensis TaxID=559956 RepID=A0ABW9G5R6_9GAMM
MASIQLKNVVKRFADSEAIHGVNLEIEDGEFTVFVGPSGCGKSTLLRMIAGLETISDGQISIDDRVVNDIAPSKRGIAMVFQSYALYPHMTVADNISYGLKVGGVGKAERRHQAEVVAKTLQLSELLDRKPKQLSGGQRQRVAIGRAIIRNPKVFLFDEPLSNLDAELRVEMRLYIAKLHQELGNTMVYVTHDQVEAMTLADKIVVLQAGSVEQVGSPMDLYYHPKNLFVAGFIGSPKMNFIPAKVTQVTPESVSLLLNGQLAISLHHSKLAVKVDDEVTLGVRPENISQEPQSVKVPFHTEVVERLGNSTYVFGQVCGVDHFKMLLPGDQHFKPYQTIDVYFKEENCLIFNAEGLCVS